GEGRAAPSLARDPDAAAVELDELAGESQPEPGALRLLVRRPDLAELLEDLLLILGRDPDAGVADRDLYPLIPGAGGVFDPPALRRELDRVRQEIQRHLTDLALIGAHLPKAPIQ